MTIRHGRRESAATAYLHPVLMRPNLTVEVHAHATRVLFEGLRASGVEYAQNREFYVARATREVILSGGSINSPQVLQLSGIGDPQILAAHGIAVKAALPGIGRNLQDHAAALLIYGRGDTSPLLRNMRLDRLALGLLQGAVFGTGFMTDLPGGITGFVKSQAAKEMPDIQLLFIAGSLAAAPYLPPFRKAFADSFACRIVLLRPESRGSVTIASADPAQHPRIAMGLLATDNDWKTLRDGIAIFRDLANSATLKNFVAREIGPGEGIRTDAALEDYVRRTAVTAHHPCGTCKMGVEDDAMAVVDNGLRVRGVENLRVVDASVFPDRRGKYQCANDHDRRARRRSDPWSVYSGLMPSTEFASRKEDLREWVRAQAQASRGSSWPARGGGAPGKAASATPMMQARGESLPAWAETDVSRLRGTQPTW